MKKISVITSVCVLLLMVLGGCKKSLEDKYLNPEKSTSGSLPGFLTAMLDNARVRPNYWNVRTVLLQHTAVYSQTAFFLNESAVYQQSDSYTGQFWNNFYYYTSNGSGPMSVYRSMEALYNTMSDAGKANQEIYMQAAKIVLYDMGSQMVDLWGDIPFYMAGSLETNSTIVNAPFDGQVDLYKTFLAGLDEAATFFSTAAVNASFSKADILLSGNIANWWRYANSLRLRLLMRMSYYDEATAKTAVLEMLNNPAKYPLVDGANVANYSPAATDILLRPLTTYAADLRDGLTELPSHYAPDYMLNTVMLPVDDPRIPVMFDKFGKTTNGVFVPNPTYKAMPVTLTSAEQENNFGNYATVDSTTFLFNSALPGIVITAPEVNFLKAEAYERWGSSANAQTAYEAAVKQSVTFYYYLNQINTAALPKVAKPADTVIDAFVTNGVSYTGNSTAKLAKIWTQKWLNFGFLQSIQAWSEYRRTGYPQLTFPAGSLAGYTTPPNRFVYTSDEKAYNEDNYILVQARDTRNAKIFWDMN